MSLCDIGAATGAGPHKPLYFQPAALCGREGAGQHVAALWPGHLHADPPGLQRQQPRSGLRQVSEHMATEEGGLLLPVTPLTGSFKLQHHDNTVTEVQYDRLQV